MKIIKTPILDSMSTSHWQINIEFDQKENIKPITFKIPGSSNIEIARVILEFEIFKTNFNFWYKSAKYHSYINTKLFKYLHHIPILELKIDPTNSRLVANLDTSTSRWRLVMNSLKPLSVVQMMKRSSAYSSALRRSLP